MGWALMGVTLALVILGCVLYVYDWVGLAQFLWVLASGTAGGGVVLLLEKHD
jgi:hypothetical protein